MKTLQMAEVEYKVEYIKTRETKGNIKDGSW